MSYAPLTEFLNMATGDPNSVAPHIDVIQKALLAKANDAQVTEADRQQARAMLAQLFPHTPPAREKRT